MRMTKVRPLLMGKTSMSKTFAITAGHSDSDPGAVAGGRKEAEIARDMRNIVATKLRERGHRVFTDGKSHENLPLTVAITLAKQAQVAVEFHCNAAASVQANGVETISLPKDKALAQRISKAVADAMGAKLRGDAGWIDQSKSARGSLGFVNAGGLIVELFFISNPAETAVWDAKKWLVATAVADALEAQQ